MNAALFNTLEAMRAELESHQHEVALIPAPRPMHAMHFVRVAVDKNPAWYRDLCRQFPSGRRDQNKHGRTEIKRRETLAAIDRLQRTGLVATVYDQRLIEAARAYYRQTRKRLNLAAAA